MVNHTQAIRRQQPKNRFSVFDHFVGLALKGLKYSVALMSFLSPSRVTFHFIVANDYLLQWPL